MQTDAGIVSPKWHHTPHSGGHSIRSQPRSTVSATRGGASASITIWNQGVGNSSHYWLLSPLYSLLSSSIKCGLYGHCGFGREVYLWYFHVLFCVKIGKFMNGFCCVWFQLLRPVASERLGSGAGGVEDIKAHPFFSGVSWPSLLGV